jgi:hypothetical protein
MSANDEGLTWERPWQIVRADLDLAHVFAPQDRISFTRNGNGYKIAHQGAAATANYFRDVVLTEVDGEQPSFDAVSSDYPLPLFSRHHKHRYRTLADRLEVFAQKHQGLRRLEGTIEIPCHGFGYQDQESGADPHDARPITTKIHVYQFANAVQDGQQRKRLLVIYKPFEPSCVTNGNGTVIGYD